jgi:hypothetical protein
MAIRTTLFKPAMFPKRPGRLVMPWFPCDPAEGWAGNHKIEQRDEAPRSHGAAQMTDYFDYAVRLLPGLAILGGLVGARFLGDISK